MDLDNLLTYSASAAAYIFNANTAAKIGSTLFEGGLGSIRTVAWLTSSAYLSQFMVPYIPNFTIPGFSTKDNYVGETNFGNITMPAFNTEEFDKGLEEIGETLGNNGSKAVSVVGRTFLVFYMGYAINNFALHYIKEYITHTMGKPTLSKKFKFDDWQATLYNYSTTPLRWLSSLIYGSKEATKIQKPIFSESIREQIRDISASLVNVQKHEGTYENVILFGPPGTGKTMTAQYISENSGMNFMEISGGDLAKFIGTKSPPVEELNKVFGRIEASSKPTVLFIDEFDGFATNRNELDIPRVEILNSFLNQTGTPSNKVLIIAATNRLDDLDPAVHSRFGEKIYMGPPDTEERLAILNMYINQFFNSEADKAVFTPEYLDKLNARLKGETGRTIYKLINKCFLKKNQQASGRISETLINKVFDNYFEGVAQINQQTN
ncbi:MAG: ATP-dependent zinc metalloprotease FtsH [Chlamydiae bacterium]|nr:ATP-dependent zinc metalloprotease FtsH [Chlamydiota bacterium]